MGNEDVVDRFLRNAEANPEAICVDAGDTKYSFKTFEVRVRQFAACFAQRPNSVVLIALPQIPDAYAAMFGAGLAGGYYSPVNIAAPLAKLKRILELLEPDFIVANGDLGRQLSNAAPRAILVNPATLNEIPPLNGSETRHKLAYVIFTSGSTGTPKGVMISRSALNSHIAWLGEAWGIRPGDRISQYPNIGFDLSVADIYGSICFGATLFPFLEPADRLMPALMIQRERITIWNSVPSAISLMAQSRSLTASTLESVRFFNFCGEPLLRQHLEGIFNANRDAIVQNTYGPTEATVSMTSILLRADNYLAACETSAALGRPIPGMNLSLVGGKDANEGEIVISGPQLAEGYWSDEQRTSERFRLADSDGAPARAYFTGDWAEWRDGNLYFRDRIDFQIKIKGYRIELDEISAAIRDCGWPVACVFKWKDGLGAVVERQGGKDFDQNTLRVALADKIEQHAIPHVILEIDSMPRSENDKLDRKAAADWFATHVTSGRASSTHAGRSSSS
ncbi:MAG: AMP-binding protein [Bradyrhizobium sp.]